MDPTACSLKFLPFRFVSDLQPERLAYFALDADSQPGKLVFKQTITLKDTWAKEAKKGN
jgi:hypothetical protein